MERNFYVGDTLCDERVWDNAQQNFKRTFPGALVSFSNELNRVPGGSDAPFIEYLNSCQGLTAEQCRELAYVLDRKNRKRKRRPPTNFCD